MLTISEMRKNFTKKDFIVDNLMKSRGVYFLVARPKVGKSLLALQLADSVATGKDFLGFKTNPSPVLYISTEMDSAQLVNRINLMNLQIDDTNFFVEEQSTYKKKFNLFDLEITFQEFANRYNGKLVIIDMFCGVDLNNGYELNDYQDIAQYVIPKYRELCDKYDLTFLLVHHLNKKNTSLGSTAIDGSIDGKISLMLDDNIKNKISFKYESRDYESQDFILKRNDNLIFEISELESEDLNINLIAFLNYSIKQKEFTFTCGEITSILKLAIAPSTFGKLLNANIDNLKKEWLNITNCRIGKERKYHAKYIEPNIDNE